MKLIESKEIWKSIPGYEELYIISNYGRIKTFGRIDRFNRKWKEKYLSLCIDSCGYHPITLCKNGVVKKTRIHRLVAQMFVENPHQRTNINHKDGNKINNHYTNLEWVTPKQNSDHAWKMGLIGKNHTRGEKHPSSKLTWSKVNKIRNLYPTGKYTTRKLAEMFGLKGHGSILSVIHYRTWKKET